MNPTGSGGSDVGGNIMVELGGSFSFSGSGGAASVATAGKATDHDARPISKSGETATGCNCKVAMTSRPTTGRWLLAALALAVLARRRHRL
jgi:MYXO-CTERM domain-containing protein